MKELQRNRRQLSARLAPELVRDVLDRFVRGELTCSEAMDSLEVKRSRLYTLRTEFLKAKASGEGASWAPRLSGGNHYKAWPDEVLHFLHKALKQENEPFSYAFATSEVERRFQFTLSRSQVRTWALANGLARQIPQRVEIHTRRWQRQRIGELFQLDATPDFFLGHTQPKLTLLNMLDDCSRLQLGCRLYLREDTMAYLDFFERTLFEYGLPFEVYVDNATFFRSTSSEAVTLLGQRLRLYGVSFRYASSPQSKGKVERVHQIWQVRIPAFLEYEGITLANTPLSEINDYVRTLLDHRNCHEIHREIGKTPQDAWDLALEEGRSCLRAVPRDGWWPLVWSKWRTAEVATHGRVYYDALHYVKVRDLPRGTRVCLCCHTDGTHTVIPHEPRQLTTPPDILGTTRSLPVYHLN